MAHSYANYTGNGIKNIYLIPFGFLAKTHIQVKINTIEISEFDVLGSTVIFDTPPVSGAAIKIYRVTPRTPLVEYYDGGSPRAKTKNTDLLQSLYISQEIEDGTLTGEAVIPNNSLTVNKLEQVSSGTFLGRYDSLTGDVQKMTAAQAKSLLSLATVATSGSYNDLSNRPTLATVATSGSYNDLTDKPTIQSINIIARAYCSGLSGSTSIVEGSGFSGIVRNSAGSYTITFSSTQTTAKYSVLLTISSGNPFMMRVTGQTTTTVSFETRGTDGVLYDANNMSIAVIK